jgi:hypothetical protein
MPTHLGGDYEPTPLLAKGSPFGVSNDRKTSLLRDRPARRAVKRAYRIWVSDAAHHCVQLRIDLLFTMSDNLHRVIEDRRDTNSMHGRALVLVALECLSRPPSPSCLEFPLLPSVRVGLPTEAAKRRRLVEPDGIEPTTSCLQSRRSPN